MTLEIVKLALAVSFIVALSAGAGFWLSERDFEGRVLTEVTARVETIALNAHYYGAWRGRLCRDKEAREVNHGSGVAWGKPYRWDCYGLPEWYQGLQGAELDAVPGTYMRENEEL